MGEVSILLAGMGGQGIVFAAASLAEALFRQGFYVAQMQSYGAEVRGGAVLAWVVFSEKPVTCPFTDEYEVAVALHQVGLEEASRKGLRWRLLIADEELVRTAGLPGSRTYPVHRAARSAGLGGRENVVALGILAGMGYVDPRALQEVLEEREAGTGNVEALRLGLELVKARFGR